MAVGTSVVLDPSNRSEPLKLHVKRIRIPLTALVSQADVLSQLRSMILEATLPVHLLRLQLQSN